MSLEIAIVNPILRTPYVESTFSVKAAGPVSASELPEINIVELGRALGDLGHRVTILTCDTFLEDEEVAVNDRVTVCAVPTRLRRIFNPGLVPFTPGLADSARLRDADVIQSGEFHQFTTFFASGVAADAGIPLVVWQETFHHMRVPGAWFEQSFEWTVGRSVRATATRFVLRTTKARAYLQGIGVPQSVIGPWVPTGIDGESFRPRSGTLHPEDFGLPRNCDLVTMVARLIPDKGVDLAIRAISLLQTKGMRVGLLVRGSGPELDRLKILARQVGVEDVVRFIGTQSRTEMANLYCSSKLFLVASRNDLFPFSLLEAGACGLPSVSARVGCVEDFVQDGVNGLLVPPDSAESLAAGIGRLLMDDDLRERMRKAARTRFEEDFDVRVTAVRLAKVYRESLDGATANPGNGGDRQR